MVIAQYNSRCVKQSNSLHLNKHFAQQNCFAVCHTSTKIAVIVTLQAANQVIVMTRKKQRANNIPPVHYTMNEDTTLLIKNTDLLEHCNIDASTLLVEGIINPQGTLIKNDNATWSFTPSKYFSGVVTLDCIVSDGFNKSIQPILVSVLHVSRSQEAPEVELLMQPDGSLLIDAQQLLQTATDIEGDNLEIISMNAPQGAFINKHNGKWKFVPNDEYLGAIDLNFVVTDGHAQVSQSLLITVNAPVFMPEIDVMMNSNAPFTFSADDLLSNATNIDGDALTITDMQALNNGQLLNNDNGTWTYLPPHNYVGPLALQFDVSDNHGARVDQALNIYAVSNALKTMESIVLAAETDGTVIITPKDLLPNQKDGKARPVTITNMASTQGKIKQIGTDHNVKWVFTPNQRFTGAIDLQYIVDDGIGQTAHFMSIETIPDAS